MPRPCAVEFHACCYKENLFETLQDATALRRGVSRLLLQRESLRNSSRCHGLAPWSFTLAATKRVSSKLFKMRRPCAVEFHARCYKESFFETLQDATALRRGVSRSLLQRESLRNSSRCHGLAPWSFTLAAIKRVSSKLFKMPRPCAVEFHVCCYEESFFETLQDATALRRGASRSLLQRESLRNSSRCHGLAPWSFTLAAIKRVSSNLFKMPRPCAVEFHVCCYEECFFETLQDATALRRGVSRLLL